MGTLELKQPLGASIIRALGLAESDIPKFILAELEREWDRSGFFSIYATFSNPTCRTATAGGGESDGPRQTDELTCCKYETISTSPDEKSKTSIKVGVAGWGSIEISGTGSIHPHVVNAAHIKPDGDCPGKCRDESIQVVIELNYHFSLHFKLSLLGQSAAGAAQFKFPAKAEHKSNSGTSSAVDIEFDWEGDTHDSMMVFADCESITTNNKDKRPWLDNLPGGGAVVHKPFDPHTALLGVDECNIDMVGHLLGFTQSGRGGRITIGAMPSVGGIIKMPPPVTYPVNGTGGIPQQQFTVWSGPVPKGCSSYIDIDAVFDLELFDVSGKSIEKEKVTVKEVVFCPDDDKVQYVRPVNFHHKAHLLLYIRVNLKC